MARIKKRLAVNCTQSSFHEDDCAGCNGFVDCLKKQEDFDSECVCWHCFWHGYYDDCGVRVIRETHTDPEERYATCPHCGQDVEPIDD